MIRYALVLILINTNCLSLGSPLPQSATNISDVLSALANTCESPVLVQNIKSKLAECNIFAPPYNEKQFACLLFYDINNQLCYAVNTSKLTVNEKQMSALTEKQDMSDLCSLAKTWNITNLAKRVSHASEVFKNPALCIKICASNDLLSLEANYFCKYYKWGLDMLKLEVDTAMTIDKNASAHISDISVPNSVHNLPAVISTQVSTTSDSATNLAVEKAELSAIDSSLPKPKTKVDENKNRVKVQDTERSSTQKLLTGNEKDLSEKDELDNENDKKVHDLSTLPDSGTNNADDALEFPINTGEDKDQEKKLDSKLKERKENTDLDDNIQDFDTGEERDQDLIENPEIEHADVLTQKQTPSKTDKTIEKIESLMPVSDDFPRRDYANDTFTEEDDHFFQFFLTSVILVIVLYILYHNKNKVSKVFLGLIVEGRQSGRRRNSRGHAYRRLDTLEQAMSSKTTAPPTKIIY